MISLEKQLEDKQRIIESLFHWPSLYVNKTSHGKEASPMGDREENNNKGKQQTTKEAKNVDNKELKEPPAHPCSKRNEDPNIRTRKHEKETTAVAESSKGKKDKENEINDTKLNQ